MLINITVKAMTVNVNRLSHTYLRPLLIYNVIRLICTPEHIYVLFLFFLVVECVTIFYTYYRFLWLPHSYYYMFIPYSFSQ